MEVGDKETECKMNYAESKVKSHRTKQGPMFSEAFFADNIT